MIELVNFQQNLQDQLEIDRGIPIFHQNLQSYKFIQDLNHKNTKQQIQTSIVNQSNICLVKQINPFQKDRNVLNQQKQQFFCIKNRKKLTIQKKITKTPLNGQGVIKLNNGDVVFATWINDKIKGNAKIVYPSGNIYVGQVKGYIKHGLGIQLQSNGESYQGNFIDGLYQGFGILKNSYKQVIKKGNWRKGKLHPKDQIW